MLLAIRQHVGMVFQNPDNQIVSNVVEEDVAFAPENLGVASQEIRSASTTRSGPSGCTTTGTYAPQLLSGGQKQRVAIAGVLAMQPQCVVLDEPTAMLDPQGRREVLDTIERLNRETGMTVILITHHMDEAARADRVIAMSEGRIVADGTPQPVFAPGAAAAQRRPRRAADRAAAAGAEAPRRRHSDRRADAGGLRAAAPAAHRAQLNQNTRRKKP